jgi:hypothetical protein
MFLIFVLQCKKFSEDGKMRETASVANADGVWRAWYKKAKIYVF